MIRPKERPILFSAPMVRAILEGRKTVTRRKVKKQAALDCLAAGFEPAFLALPGNADLCPYGQPGDRLWVRETWAADAQLNAIAPRELSQGEPILFPADGALREVGCSMISPGRSRPSIHMPRWASRILLEITEVRVERLQDITHEDAAAEGVHRDSACRMWTATDEGGTCHRYPTPAFKDLWTGINGLASWNTNPWVWVVEFKQVTL
ncbi:hypothetical protein ACCD10_17965 [Pseudomonas sp. Pseusp122]|uniref:hypothetical protein n=1 Tax=unclassified Pseudomonas TaxID=196821 RepID=UPI0039A50F63